MLSDEEIDRIVPALEPVSEDFPAEWAVWKDRERIRKELRAARTQADSVLEDAGLLVSTLAPNPEREAGETKNVQYNELVGLLKEARKIIRASSSRQLAKDWDRRATQALRDKSCTNEIAKELK